MLGDRRFSKAFLRGVGFASETAGQCCLGPGVSLGGWRDSGGAQKQNFVQRTESVFEIDASHLVHRCNFEEGRPMGRKLFRESALDFDRLRALPEVVEGDTLTKSQLVERYGNRVRFVGKIE